VVHLVKYQGSFGFIKPWTAVRDSTTFSQQFLTPSIIEGIEKKLFPELLKLTNYQRRIVRYRLSYEGISEQQEQTQPKAWTAKGKATVEYSRPRSIITRGVLINPILYLAFDKHEYAKTAIKQHICLCRNEDVLLPSQEIVTIEELEFDNEELSQYHGFELRFEQNERSFLVGYNRFTDPPEPMHGWLHIVGNPIRRADDE
jgi:hypothetical protein